MKLSSTQCHRVFGKGDSRTTQQGKTRTFGPRARVGWLFCAGVIRSWLHDWHCVSGRSAWMVPHGGIGFAWNGRRLAGFARLAWSALPDVPCALPIVNMRPTRFRVRLAHAQGFVHDFIHFHRKERDV